VSALWVYALVSVAPPDAGRGLSGEPLRLISSGGVLAVVGDLPALPPVDEATLRLHDAVVRRLAAEVPAVLPARFGSAVADETELRERLAPRAAALDEALRLVTGREQMTLRVWGEARAAAGSEARQACAEGASPAATAAGGPGTRHLAGRARARRRALEVPEIAWLRRVLDPLVRAERVERHATPGLLATVHHLVDRGAAPVYVGLVETTGGESEAVRVTTTGPWPPYAFAAGGVA
jgi:hypothetical protein